MELATQLLELSVSLHSFINVEMRSQGHYAIRVKLLPSPRIKAAWVYTGQLSEPVSGQEPVSSPGLQAGPEEGWSWRSHVFRIQYCQDVVTFPEPHPCFQVFVRQPDDLGSLDLCVELQLLAQTLGPTQLDAPCTPSRLRSVAKCKLRLCKVAEGHVDYWPASWGIDFWGLCHVNLASSLTGFATRTSMHSMGVALGKDLRQPHSRSLLPISPRKQDLFKVGLAQQPLTTDKATSPPTTMTSPRSPGGELSSPSKSVPLSVISSTSSLEAVQLGASRGRSAAVKPATLLHFLQSCASSTCSDFNTEATSPGGSPPLSQLSHAAITCLQQLYIILVAPLQQCTAHVTHVLRSLPAACYHPQTYDSMRALLHDIPAVSHTAFNAAAAANPATARHTEASSPLSRFSLRRVTSSVAQLRHTVSRAASGSSSVASSLPCSPRQAAGGVTVTAPAVVAGLGLTREVAVADVAGWTCQGPDDFIRQLPVACSPGMALQYLHALITRLTTEAGQQWSMLQWVLDQSGAQVARHFRQAWEGDQPRLTTPWIMMAKDVQPTLDSSADERSSASRMAAVAHRQLQTNTTIMAPRVHHASVWDYMSDQPVLCLDDSLAPHMAGDAFMIDATSDRSETHTTEPAAQELYGPTFRNFTGRKSDVHLMVFVHGYAGAPIDLGPIKAHIHALYPSLECRLSGANERQTHDSMDVMGRRLADEVLGWVRQIGTSAVRHISFVGHSLGVMIIRAALAQPKTSAVLDRLWLLLSIGGPHLGQMYNKNRLVSAGMTFLKAVNRDSCLQQLDLHDAVGQDPTTSWLYRFITAGPEAGGALQRFKRVVLVACEQDGYVPYHSSALTLCDAAKADSSWKGKAYRDMLEASLQIFGTCPDAPQLLRVGVHFPRAGSFPRPGTSMMSDVLGRTAHIALIENDEFARLLAWSVVRRYNLVKPEQQPAWL